MSSGTPNPTGEDYPVVGHAIAVVADVECLLRDVPFEDVTEALLRLPRIAARAGLARPEWLPTILVQERHTGRYALCLDHPGHAVGSGEARLRAATEQLADVAPDPGEGMSYVLVRDMPGMPHAAKGTFRLRTEHWRALAWSMSASLERVLRPVPEQPRGALAIGVIAGAGGHGGPNPIRSFARGRSHESLAAFARAVGAGDDPLHHRIAFLAGLAALSRVRVGSALVRTACEETLDVLESEAAGEYHLDGQAAVRCLRAARPNQATEVLEP